ncbi:MAG: hypothetical protein MJ153_01610 [Clostridia bacterium]|nr:hypothetical protein [Clostridia bacterium]
MADNLKNKKIGSTFDENNFNLSRNNESLFGIIWSTISNRFFVLASIFTVFGIIILFMTASLQFSGYQRTISASSEGVQRQYNTDAPRGNIYDSNGVLLASSEQNNTVMIANAYLDDDKLNSLALELSYLFDEYNCVSVSDLDDYFAIDPYVFKKDETEIRRWQTNRNLFNLEDYTQGIIVTFTDNYVKTDPQVFFLYLRQLFKIDNDYSVDEAYRIIRIRYQIFQDQWAFDNGAPIVLATDVPSELNRLFDEQNYHYQGVIHTVKYRRTYTPLAQLSCHVVGYIGNISQESLSVLQEYGYTNDDMVGKSGVESQMERYLHGTHGVSTYSIWTEKGEEDVYYPSEYGMDAIPGADCYLTIDSNLQRVGIEALKSYIQEGRETERREQKGYKTANAGAFVMMNVNSGAVLAMGSYPNFDPNDFVLSMYGDAQAEEQVKYYLGLDEYEDITAEDMPLWNRAIMSQYAPGSTFKMCTALAGLESGVITPNSTWLRCEGPYKVDDFPFKCLEYPETGHGALSLYSAIATSCNIYFMKLGVDTGIDNIDAMGERLGLGEFTGVDLPGEICGVRASRETKRLLHESEYDRTWFPADTAQSAIGQFDNCFTILQLCRYTAAIATNELVTPYVIDKVVASDGSILYQGQSEPQELGINEENLNTVRQAMSYVVGVAEGWDGTARDSFQGFGVDICCKTGTAETGFEEIRKEYSNALFVCYAPASDPEVAIALVVERGEWGAKSVVIAKKLLAAYFGVPLDQGTKVIENHPFTGDILSSIEPSGKVENN